ncbi:type IV toxin-antitoxin system AbiEi family antitoxin domain-containing protein [Modestobacter altitudinis]|uniref:type IV toxin-antitoxin system AbiEi family antitoxin domain-containing protein n=1 Tax=Modestobacter altitudinis TaxID=2213158 RepID=UPI001FEA8E64|nr:type IV toxin-antitoxin system AbiEi family antitoxin domain-containing protein [Modestobacter altitudinis]
MHPVLREAARRQWGVFTAADVRRAGLAPADVQSAIRRREWDRLRRGVYVEREVLEDASQRGDAMRHRLDCAAVLLCLGGEPAVSHASAARLLGFLVPAPGSAGVSLTAEEQWRKGRGYSVMRAGLPPQHVRMDGGFRITGPARTLVDCAREWSLENAVMAMDAALHGGALTAAELRSAVLEQTHWFGIGAAARAAGLADGRAESPLETRGRLRIIGSGLPLPELQVDLHGPRGFVARVDAWYEEAAVAVEFDGRVKYDDPFRDRTAAEVLWEEKRREDEIRDLGGRVLRVTHADVGSTWHVKADRLHSMLTTPSAVPRRLRTMPTSRDQRPSS